jgi:putative hydrolase of the HAD superfamily
LKTAIVFDLGKVLVDFDYSIAARKIAANGTMAVNEIGPFVSQSCLLVDFEKGRLTGSEFIAEACAGIGYRGTHDEFAESFADIFTPIPAMVELQAAFRKSGFPTYILSNTNELAVGHIRRRFPFYDNFDGYILSYEQGVMKPEARIYEIAEQMAGQTGAGILYIDDLPANVAGGAARGWQTILHESPEKTKATLKKLGLLPAGLGDL